MFSLAEAVDMLGSEDRNELVGRKLPSVRSVEELVPLLGRLSAHHRPPLVKRFRRRGMAISRSEALALVNVLSAPDRSGIIRVLWPQTDQQKETASQLMQCVPAHERLGMLDFFDAWKPPVEEETKEPPSEPLVASGGAATAPSPLASGGGTGNPVPSQGEASTVLHEPPDAAPSAQGSTRKRKLADTLPKMEDQPDWDRDKDSGHCVMCIRKRAVVTLAPCGHRCVCVPCIRDLVKNYEDKTTCPICVGEIEAAVRTYE